jgi:hypothetical protein
MSWLDQIVKQHAELESPLSFWRWAGIAAISAVVKDQVYLNKQIYKLYPNIYVMLHADSGLKKGPPISMAKQLVTKVNNTRVISGRSSIQGILKEMGTAVTEKGSGKVISTSTAFICSNELTSSIVGDKVAADILTDLYDRSYNIGQWRSLLKMESFELKNPTISMLTATNEAHSTDFFGTKDVQGGYFARTFIIHESQRNKVNSLLAPLVDPPNYDDYAKYLKQLGELKGGFEELASLSQTDTCTIKATDGEGRDIYYSAAGKIYEDWYHDFVKSIDDMEEKDETGTLNRFGDSVLKVAMILSLAEHPKLEITESAMLTAIKYCERLVGNIRKTTMGRKGLSQSAALKGKIINELLHRPNHIISQQMLMKKMWMDYASLNEFVDVMNSFEGAGIIKGKSIGNQIVYEMVPVEAEKLKKFLEGKNR